MFDLDWEKKISRVRSKLLSLQPWYGSLAMRLRFEANDEVDTMSTNGSIVRVNTQWTISASEDDVMFVLAHEVGHCALAHPYRCYSRDLEVWNDACDYVVNRDLVAAGFQPIERVLLNSAYDGMSADVVYARLMHEKREKEEKGEEPEPKDPQDQPGTGDFTPAPADGEGDGDGDGDSDGDGQGDGQKHRMTAHDWRIACETATMVCNKAGNTPAGAAMSAKTEHDSGEDWRAALREFVANTQPSDFSWARPNRRHIHAGLYLPGVVKENIGKIGVGWDSSGSMFSQRVQNVIATELTAIIQETQPDGVEVVYCDCAIQRIDTFEPDDEIVFNAAGGGGTAFQPVFDHFNEADEQPLGVVYFTDLYGDNDTVKEPDYPVLWVTGKNSTMEPPFGRVIRIAAEME